MLDRPMRIGAAAAALLAASPIARANAADPAAGKADFQSACAMCHATQPGANRIGPTLAGIVGRHSGAEAAYSYSPQNKAANLTWDPATLDRYLASPRDVIPGTKMTYAGLKDPAKRADLIAYLQTLR